MKAKHTYLGHQLLVQDDSQERSRMLAEIQSSESNCGYTSHPYSTTLIFNDMYAACKAPISEKWRIANKQGKLACRPAFKT